MGKTAIEWADETWNPIVGCAKVSAGCKNCYAERLHNMRHRAWLDGWKSAPEQYHNPFGEVRLIAQRLDEPWRWRKPRAVLCCSMGDLFHEDVPARDVLAVLNTMEQANADRLHAGKEPHRFMVLTKRARRMRNILEAWFDEFSANGVEPVGASSIWFGVSVESQQHVDRAIELVSIRSPVPLTRFVSAEPLLGPLSLAYAEHDGGIHNLLVDEEYPGRIDWIIVGGETGPGARPMHPEWVRTLRDEAHDYGAAFFFKQWGEWFPREQWEFNPELILPDDDVYEHDPNTVILEDHTVMHRVGRRKAGRMLDGFIWDEYPAAEGAK